jgi:hypothetical protein
MYSHCHVMTDPLNMYAQQQAGKTHVGFPTTAIILKRLHRNLIVYGKLLTILLI